MDNKIYVCENCIEIFDKETELINHQCKNSEKKCIIDNLNNIDEEIKRDLEKNEKKIIIKNKTIKTIKPIKKTEICKCKKCGFETKYKNNLYRHNKHFCKNNLQSN